MAGPARRLVDGQLPGWSGIARSGVPVTKSDVTLYEPPLLKLVASGSGNVVVLLDADDEDANTLGAVSSSGTTPPVVAVTGTPLSVVSVLKLDVTLGGLRGTATFQYSTDNGSTYNGVDLLTAATVVLGATGLTAVFPTGTYNADNLYTATATNAAYLTIALTAGVPLQGFAIRQVRTAGTTATGLSGGK